MVMLLFLCLFLAHQLLHAQMIAPPALAPTPATPTPPSPPQATPTMQPANYPVEIINGTDWEIIVGYTTPAGVATTDSVSPNFTKKIIAKNLNITYSLAKEQGKVKTATQQIPIDFVQRGIFQLSPETIKDAIKEFIEIKPAIDVSTKK